MSWEKDKGYLTNYAQLFQKDIKLHNKDNWFCRALSWIVFIITFGKKDRKSWMENVAFAAANHHFYPAKWSTKTIEDKIPHEAFHTKDMNACGLFIHPMVGLLPFLILYYLVPIPIGFAYARLVFELRAKEAEWMENKPKLQAMQTDADKFVESISGATYLWAVPKFFAKRQTDKVVEKVYATYLG